MNNVPPGYKQTEVGVIPEEWDVKPLQDVFALKSGFAFSSEHFSKVGPIVLTPGNFLLEGGLYFEDRNTKRYSGSYSPKMTFIRGDLLIVMTDLTPDCNLLGKPAFVDSDDVILHNQRIGKVVLKDKSVELPLLFYMLLSRRYLARIKEQATGSTVRHTSNKSIYSVQLPWPPPPEQRAIATALSDVDALLGALDRLIAKKRDLKQAAMQQLLTGQTRLPGFQGEWEVRRLGDVVEIVMGQSPSSSNYNTNGTGLPLIQGNADISNRETIKRIFTTQITKRGKSGDILMSVRAPVGEISRAIFDVCLGRGVCAIRFDNDFMYHCLIYLEPTWAKHSKGSTFDSVNSADVKALEVNLPTDTFEQTAIAAVLTDMDTELAALTQRLAKTRALKQGMMQELLTGRTRLV